MCALPVQLTPLIGREREVADVVTMIDGTRRIVTLTGPGGTGKTRLGLQAAAEVVDRFEDGVNFVNLAPVRDAELVAPAIASSLGLSQVAGEPVLETVKTNLRDKRMLLLVDNFEQVSDAAAQVGQLASAAPGVTVLVTSRVPLFITGEYECPVPPLELDEAVRLFVDRARAINPSFDPTDEVYEICARLDGLPLAVELAAARTRSLTPRAMLKRLGLNLLTGGARDADLRQRTLRATIAWSHDLLSDVERRLFAQLAVFSGGATLDAVEAVCADADAVDALVRNNLLRHVDGRFVMLTTIHEFAREQLGESERYRSHCEYFLDLAERLEPALWKQTSLAAALETLESEHDNLRAALRWAFRCDTALAVRLVAALWRFWHYRGHWHEGRRWLDRALPSGGAEVWFGSAVLQTECGNTTTAEELLRRCVAGYRQEGRLDRAAFAVGKLGDLAYASGDHETARALLEEAIAQAAGFDAVRSMLLGNLGEVMRATGDDAAALALNEESLALVRAEPSVVGLIQLCNLGNVVHRLGDCERALQLFTEALTVSSEVGLKDSVALCLLGFAGVAATLGTPRRAARLFGAAERMLEELGAQLWPADRRDYEHNLAAAQAQLSAREFTTLRAEGRRMSQHEAVDYAMWRTEAEPPAAPGA